MKKLIGIVGHSGGEASFCTGKAYLEFFKYFSDNLVILTPNSFIPNLDLLVLPGGKDVINGGGGDFSFNNSPGEAFLEHFDKNTLPKYIEAGIPIWGTCRGFQSLCNHFGVPIQQDITMPHGYSKNEYDYDANEVFFHGEFGYLRTDQQFITEKKKACFKIGSWHHQYIETKSLEGHEHLVSVAGTADGVCEYMISRRHRIAGAQGHVERDGNALAVHMIQELLNQVEDPIFFPHIEERVEAAPQMEEVPA